MSDNPLEFDAVRDQRIRKRAYHLWEEDGCPEGRDLEYWERARELVAMEDSDGAGQLPNPAIAGGNGELVEEASLQENLGEFPDRFTDQGDRAETPSLKNLAR
jgi:hypothetical protein